MLLRCSRRSLAVLAVGIAMGLLGACDPATEGAPRVIVIGDEPSLADANAGPLNPADALLIENAAQGLVALDGAGNVVPGLAERWNVSNDGLSYIFRIAPTKWSDGSKITAEQVARALRRQILTRNRNAMRDSLGAVSEVVAMTDRVVEIRLAAPRPNLLPLLARPEFGIIRNGIGSGPFTIAEKAPDGADLLLERDFGDEDDEAGVQSESVRLSARPANQAVADFMAGKADLVLGGTFADLPFAQRVERPRGALRFDPASGLFGLVPVRKDGEFTGEEWRALLTRAIDRDAILAALGVPGLAARATLLEPGLDGLPAPVAPAWAGQQIAERRAALEREGRRLVGTVEEAPTIRVLLPEGPGADGLIKQLTLDWSYLGLKVERAADAAKADYAFVDEVAPSSSPAWFARRFRCETAVVCDPALDELVAAARLSPIPSQRYALFAQAAALVDEKVLFIPIAAPVRWSLVGDRIGAFAGNRFARHPLSGLSGEPAARD